MKKEEWITKRTEIISRMLDNPDEYDIYPTTQCYKELDELFDSLQSTPVTGIKTAEEIENWFKTNIEIITLGEDEEGYDVLMRSDPKIVDNICKLHQKAMKAYHNQFESREISDVEV